MKKLILILSLLVSAISLYAADKPSFPGGEEELQKYIAANLKYPARAMQNGIEGIVPLQFIVKADGTISSVKVVRMIDPDLEAAAISLVKGMPAWLPAMENGQPIQDSATLEVVFRLPED